MTDLDQAGGAAAKVVGMHGRRADPAVCGDKGGDVFHRSDPRSKLEPVSCELRSSRQIPSGFNCCIYPRNPHKVALLCAAA